MLGQRSLNAFHRFIGYFLSALACIWNYKDHKNENSIKKQIMNNRFYYMGKTLFAFLSEMKSGWCHLIAEMRSLGQLQFSLPRLKRTTATTVQQKGSRRRTGQEWHGVLLMHRVAASCSWKLTQGENALSPDMSAAHGLSSAELWHSWTAKDGSKISAEYLPLGLWNFKVWTLGSEGRRWSFKSLLRSSSVASSGTSS